MLTHKTKMKRKKPHIRLSGLVSPWDWQVVGSIPRLVKPKTVKRISGLDMESPGAVPVLTTAPSGDGGQIQGLVPQLQDCDNHWDLKTTSTRGQSLSSAFTTTVLFAFMTPSTLGGTVDVQRLGWSASHGGANNRTWSQLAASGRGTLARRGSSERHPAPHVDHKRVLRRSFRLSVAQEFLLGWNVCILDLQVLFVVVILFLRWNSWI